MAEFILDCSLTMAWCFASEQTPRTQALLSRLTTDEALVPSLWPLEVANVLLVGERRGKITLAQSAQFVAALRSLPIVVEPDTAGRIWDQVLPLAREHRLSSYDAAYLELTLRTGLALATLDANLQKVAKALGVAVL